MRHRVAGKQLSRTKNERRRLFQNLAKALIRNDKITTTVSKAKAVQPLVESLVTKAKAGTDTKRREVFAVLADRVSTNTLMDMAKDRFSTRTSGYTRILKLGRRRGDAAEKAVLMFVDPPVDSPKKPEKAAKTPLSSKKAGRKNAQKESKDEKSVKPKKKPAKQTKPKKKTKEDKNK